MQKRTDFFDNSLFSTVPDIPLVIRNKPHNNQLCADLSRLISPYPVVSHFLRFAWQTTPIFPSRMNTRKSTTDFFAAVSGVSFSWIMRPKAIITSESSTQMEIHFSQSRKSRKTSLQSAFVSLYSYAKECGS